MVLYFITGNEKKFIEINKIIPNLIQYNLDLAEIQSNDAHEIILAKLNEALKYESSEFIVEDTSLYLNCLNGLPGPLIKWFLEALGNEGLANLAIKLGDTQAQAKTIIGYAKNRNEISFFEGSIKGNIVLPRVREGFGWDLIFQPSGFNKTFAEMTLEEKNKISMRKIAAEKLKEFLIK
jgi:non-canonical purine NTP pyrophosphatase (RdgB/HAM1 family)